MLTTLDIHVSQVWLTQTSQSCQLVAELTQSVTWSFIHICLLSGTSHRIGQCNSPSIYRSLQQSVNLQVNATVCQLTGQCNSPSIYRSMQQSINLQVNATVHQFTGQCNSPSIYRSMQQSVNLQVNATISQFLQVNSTVSQFTSPCVH